MQIRFIVTVDDIEDDVDTVEELRIAIENAVTDELQYKEKLVSVVVVDSSTP